MNNVDHLCRLEFQVSFDHVEIFASLLELHCDSVIWIADQGGFSANLVGFLKNNSKRADIREVVKVAAETAEILPPKLQFSQITSKNWLSENIKQFPPQIVGRYFIYGSNFIGPSPVSTLPIFIPASEAFGTGYHASTKGCLVALDGMKIRSIQLALDMGCGSGILALAIAKRWRCKVLAADLDPKALSIAKENVRLNGERRFVTVFKSSSYDRRSVRGQSFNLIVSNIFVRPLVRMSYDLSKILAPRGIVILSGLLAIQEKQVLVRYRELGLQLNRRITLDGWTTLVLSKES